MALTASAAIIGADIFNGPARSDDLRILWWRWSEKDVG